MKIVLLAGGFGTRLSEYTDSIPKPMVEIGGKPIIWHIMKRYADYGYKDFVIALGYKADVIKNYFASYHLGQNDYTVNLSTGGTTMSSSGDLDWNVTLVDTGLNTMTGGRVKRLQQVIGNDDFMVTYGDGLSNIDIHKLIQFHKNSGKIATLSAVFPTARFGELDIDDSNNVKTFMEKPQLGTGRINGGFFVFNSRIFDFIEGDETILERDPMENLVAENELAAYKHDGFWQSMDTIRERQILEELWKSGKALWK